MPVSRGVDGKSEMAFLIAESSIAAAIGIGAALGLGLGILVSVITEVPLAPEIGLALGALAGWLSGRDSG